MQTRCRLALMLALAVPIGKGDTRALSPDVVRDRAIVRLVRRFMRDRCHVGLSIVVRSGGRDAFYNYGTVRRGSRTRPNTASVYELGSVTKTFTGLLAARGMIDGRMTLDGDFRRWLPGANPNLARDGKPITLRTLATHTSGLPRDYPDTDDLFRDPDPDTIGAAIIARDAEVTRAGTLEALHDIALRSTPGETFAYSNLGIRVIGFGLERAYRTALGRLLARQLIEPLEMVDTGFALSPSMRARLMTPYSRHRKIQPYHDATAGAAYGLYSTPRDMDRYLRWQLTERSPTVRLAHALIRGTEADGQGLIWNIGRDGDARMLWHGGGTFGMTAQMVLYPGDAEGYVLLANDACEGTEEGLKKLAMRIHKLPSKTSNPALAARVEMAPER